MIKPTDLHATSKHTLTLLVSLYAGLKKVAAERNLEPNEVIVELIEDYLINGNHLDEEVVKMITLKRTLVSRVVEAARKLWESSPSESITLDAIDACTGDKEWLNDYKYYIGDELLKHGNPLKIINREFGFRIRADLDAVAKKDENGKPVNIKVQNPIIQSYTPLLPKK